VATASDDGFVHVWEGGDDGGKQAVASFEIGCPVTAVAWSADGANLYAGAVDNEIHVSNCVSSLHKGSLTFLGVGHAQRNGGVCFNWTH